MIEAASIDLDTDLRDFSRHLQSQGIAHRITEESGQQVLWVDSEHLVRPVQQALQTWQDNPELRAEAARWSQAPSIPTGGGLGWRLARQLVAVPITSMLTLLCLLVALVSALGSQSGRVDFLFFPLLDSDSLGAMLGDIGSLSELLRTFTPMLLHFGELHLIFNLLWLWFFGRQLEPLHPFWLYLGLVLAMAFISNTTQYLSVQYNNFGGMSGVVYGLVGYTWVIHNFMPRSRLLLNNSMFVFFVIALVLMELLAGSFIATAAHVGGLLSGLLLGLVIVAYYRLVLNRAAISRQS